MNGKSDPMECEALITYLSEYIDQELDEELREDAQVHLATCHNCKVVLDTTQKMIFLYRQSGPEAIPAARRGAFFERIDTALNQRRESDGG